MPNVISPTFDYDIDDLYLSEDMSNKLFCTFSTENQLEEVLSTIKSRYKIIYNKPYLDGQFRKDVSNKKLLKIFPNFKFTGLKEGLKQVYDKIS